MVEGSYRLGGVRVGIRSTSEVVGRWVDEVLAEHRMRRWTDATYSLVVAEGDAAGPGRRVLHVLYRGIEPLVRTADLGTMARALLADVESHAFAGRDDAIYLHGAVMAGTGGIALIPSPLATAVGRLSRRAGRLGLRLPGSIWAAVDPGSGRVIPVRSALGVGEDAVERLTGPGGIEPAGNGAPDRWFVEAPTRVDRVVVPRDDGAPGLEPASRSLALYRFASMSVNLPRLGGRRTLEGLGRLMAGADCFSISPARPMGTLTTLAGLVAGGEPLRAPP